MVLESDHKMKFVGQVDCFPLFLWSKCDVLCFTVYFVLMFSRKFEDSAGAVTAKAHTQKATPDYVLSQTVLDLFCCGLHCSPFVHCSHGTQRNSLPTLMESMHSGRQAAGGQTVIYLSIYHFLVIPSRHFAIPISLWFDK